MSTTLSISGAAALHKISQKAIRHAIKNGDLKAEKLPGPNGQYLLQSKDIGAWIAKRDVAPGSSGFFAALARLNTLPALIEQHHSITEPLDLADVVVGCKCSPTMPRDAAGWALHLRDVMSGVTETSGAVAS